MCIFLISGEVNYRFPFTYYDFFFLLLLLFIFIIIFEKKSLHWVNFDAAESKSPIFIRNQANYEYKK